MTASPHVATRKPEPPSSTTDDNPVEWLLQQPFAHRGLHNMAENVPENSLAAFERALAQGHGIELDVRVTRDLQAVVFNDAALERMTRLYGPVSGTPALILNKTPLLDTDQTIPTLSQALDMVNGRGPVLIEAKAEPAMLPFLCVGIRRALEGYGGNVAVMSFNPGVLAWFAKNAPRVLRGLVTSDQPDVGSPLGRSNLGRLWAMWRAKPNFLAYDVRSLPSPLSESFRQRGIPVLAWTVSSEESTAYAQQHADNIIYELPSAEEEAFSENSTPNESPETAPTE